MLQVVKMLSNARKNAYILFYGFSTARKNAYILVVKAYTGRKKHVKSIHRSSNARKNAYTGRKSTKKHVKSIHSMGGLGQEGSGPDMGSLGPDMARKGPRRLVLTPWGDLGGPQGVQGRRKAPQKAPGAPKPRKYA